MKALVYNGPGKKSWVDKQPPQLQSPTDAIVRILKTTICGTDLHILKGDVPTCQPGTTLGHEGIGVIEAVGSAVGFSKQAIKCSFLALLPVHVAIIADAACIHNAALVGGSLAIPSMAPKLNMCGFLMPTPAFIPFLKTLMKLHW